MVALSVAALAAVMSEELLWPRFFPLRDAARVMMTFDGGRGGGGAVVAEVVFLAIV